MQPAGCNTRSQNVQHCRHSWVWTSFAWLLTGSVYPAAAASPRPSRYGPSVLSSTRSRRRSRISRGVLAAFFVGAGVLHFVKPEPYESIMPPQLPFPRELIYGSGVAEILGGLGVLSSRLRPWAGLWLIGLLIAVFPANVYHAFAADEIPGNPAPLAVLIARLPLQALLIAWVWMTTGADRLFQRRSRARRAKDALRRRR